MEVTRVVRSPQFFGTPRRLARALGVQTHKLWSRSQLTDTDFVLDWSRGGSSGQNQASFISNFYRSNKRDQRRYLHEQGIPVPQGQDTGLGYVVRPLRHVGGNGWRVTQEATDYNPATEYIAPIFNKRHEYRVIYVFGRPVLTLYKRVESSDPLVPWNHSSGSSFVTVRNPSNDRLRHSGITSRLSNVPVVKHSHLIAADVMLDDRNQASVCELNFSPGINIHDNITEVCNAIRNTNPILE